MRRIISMVLVLALALFAGLPIPVQPARAQSQFATSQFGEFYAPLYGTWRAAIVSGNTTTGSGTSIIVTAPTPLSNGTQIPIQAAFSPQFLTPILVSDANAETVTPTSISIGSCPLGGATQCATITGTFNNTHGASNSNTVQDGTFGLGTAEVAAFIGSGGTITIDGNWNAQGGTNAMITALLVVPTVSIQDERAGVVRFWNPTPTGAALAVPATLTGQTACDSTHQFCSDATVAGSASYAGGTLFGCVAYVDIMGNEGPCSLTNSFTDVSAKAIDVAAPAASPGAVGYVVYLSLDAGTYAQAYQIPSTSLNCTLTTLETTLPACAVTNTKYGQTVSTFGAAGLFTKGGSQITTIAVNTGQHFTQLGSTAMTAASMTPISNSSVTYSYEPGNRVGIPGVSSANVINYAASGSSATTIPNAIATWTIPPGALNFIGAEVRVKGFFTFTDGGDTSDEIRVAWDSPGTNTTTIPTALCAIKTTATGAAAAQNGTYECTIKIATTGATGTALVNGWGDIALAAGQTTLVRSGLSTATAASGSINLTASGRIVVYYIGTGATNNPGAQGLHASLEALN